MDDRLWPKKRTLKLFHDWFKVEYHSVIEDTVGDLQLEMMKYKVNNRYQIHVLNDYLVVTYIRMTGTLARC